MDWPLKKQIWTRMTYHLLYRHNFRHGWEIKRASTNFVISCYRPPPWRKPNSQILLIECSISPLLLMKAISLSSFYSTHSKTPASSRPEILFSKDTIIRKPPHRQACTHIRNSRQPSSILKRWRKPPLCKLPHLTAYRMWSKDMRTCYHWHT
ncbi:hypothetical protein K431DRAFT_157957 [Polychaeton citri CBS 116435]|uniref:Uncharacterized protein n=1 Tax=Polychaeton citri CBS 116435 TaxID=1314669 RepID=A0A9P4Q3L9_9PEZI|nr:hypothetical protein K431DRAFT_157957 [Polychaeton citri CBS 116435]